jgi:hypothetical protein
MKFKENQMDRVTKMAFIAIATALAGCAPQGQHYHSANYEASYDPIVYTPQDTARPFYDHNYYRYDADEKHN